ncbi:MAG: hypothetical protein KAR42_00040 [candidate division Zixibacteria bacterium]|nr:hypothetical protein [candidate division Zixibacteria bacterium]
MFDPITITIIISAYVGLLFLIAQLSEKYFKHKVGKYKAAVIYSLSIAVYCTSWTYYGSVGKAVVSGPLFLAIYIGPTIVISLWWLILRKLSRARELYGITSIADFLSARYGKSQWLAFLATLLILIGISPYMALQIKAITTSFEIITAGVATNPFSLSSSDLGLIVVGLMIVFTIAFGARKLNTNERHEGLIFAIAIESVVKITIFLSIGIFATFYLANGFEEVYALSKQLFSQLSENGAQGSIPSIGLWLTYLVLAMSAVIFLPRQFHVLVVENKSEEHIKKAIWIFPVYMFLINIFVIPIAVVGLSQGLPVKDADFFLLHLPLVKGFKFLTVLSFIGGFSAATSMLIVSSLSIATMITNHIFVPIIQLINRLKSLERATRLAKWIAIALVIITGYVFEQFLGNTHTLVNMGMLSFAASFQFVPAIIGGLFWKNGNKFGAFMGISAGFFVWFYTLLYPSLVNSGWFDPQILTSGLWGISWLRPEALFGLDSLNSLTHGVFWTFVFNTGLYIWGSLQFSPSAREERASEEIVEILHAVGNTDRFEGDYMIDLNNKKPILIGILGRYFEYEKASEVFTDGLRDTGLNLSENVKISKYADLVNHIEKHLAGYIGISASNNALDENTLYSPDELHALQSIYQKMMVELKLKPSEMAQKINIYREKQRLISENALLLEKQVNERTHLIVKANKALELEVAEREKMGEMLLEHQYKLDNNAKALEQSNKELQDFAFVASHDLQEPLRKIGAFSDRLNSLLAGQINDKASDYLVRIIDAARRMQGLINGLMEFSRIATKAKPFSSVSIEEIVSGVVNDLELIIDEKKAIIEFINLPEIEADELQMRQLFQNLISNSIKYCHEDVSPHIVISTHTSSVDTTVGEYNSPSHCHIKIEDNGIGFDNKYADRIFQPFQRLHARQQYEGTGIGLAICKKIIDRHLGKISVFSVIDKGTIFDIELPIIQEEKETHSEYA